MKANLYTIIAISLVGVSSGQGISVIDDGMFLHGYRDAAVLRQSSISLARETGSLARVPQRRFRGGLIGVPVVDVPAPVQTDAKGGMVAPKGAVVAAPEKTRWEIFGGLFYLDEQVDQENAIIDIGDDVRVPVPLRPEYDAETIGGMLGMRYMLNDNWGIGGLVNYSETDVDASVFGTPAFSVDIENWAIVPFVDYIQEGVFGSADLWAGFSYAYGMQEYELLGVPIDLDGDTHTLELGVELAWDAGVMRHGPFLGVRYIDGDVDLPGAIDIDVESFATTLGYQLSFPVEISGGTMIPSVNVAWEHEFEDNFTPAFGPTTTIDEDVLVAGAGIGWYLDSGWNFVINYRGRFGEDAESHYGGLKIGKTF